MEDEDEGDGYPPIMPTRSEDTLDDDEEPDDMRRLLRKKPTQTEETPPELACCAYPPQKIGNIRIISPRLLARTGWGLAGPHWM